MSIADKMLLRSEIKSRLNAMSADVRRIKSEQICADIISSGIFDECYDVMLYNALANEVDVQALIDYCYELDIRVYLPRVAGDTLEVVAYTDKMNVGAYGILEPIGDAINPDLDLVIVPVMGIDAQGNRLGKGKGFYDRFLVDKDVMKIAVAFSEQVLESIPVEPNDIVMDKVYYR